MSIPPLFRCPISLDLFTDPVTLCTGQTYDRPSIEKWLADGNRTCPVTMQRLHDLSMVPNHTLRHLIDQWLLMDSRFDLEHIKMIDPDLSLVTLKSNLQSQETTFSTRIQALRRIRTLSEESDSRRFCLIQLDFFPLLLQLLFRSRPTEATNLTSQDLEFAEEALNCLLNLAPCRKLGSLNMLKEASCLASFGILLDQGTVKIKTSLCLLVDLISSSSVTKDLCLALGQIRALLHGLVSLFHHKSYQCASDAATKAISGLCSLEPNRDNIIREGGIDGLLAYLTEPDRRHVSEALATLELLLGVESGKRAAIRNPSSVHVLMKFVFRVSDHEGSESAVSSLLIICCESSQIRAEAINAGALRQLLLLLQSQSSGRAKTKARVLLKLLRSMWVEDPSSCNL